MSKKLKIFLGISYLLILFIFLYYIFSSIQINRLNEFSYYKDLQSNLEGYVSSNIAINLIYFFIFAIIWVALLGFGSPILLFSGFVFGKWYGIIIAVVSASIGTTLLYLLAKLFFTNLIKEKLEPKFSSLKLAFQKNEFLYFTLYRLGGGGGIPYGIQNVLPVLFNISIKNYFLGTFIGSWPTMFISVALGAGIEKYIETNEELSLLNVILSPDIYLPILGFILMLLVGLVIKKLFFKKN